MIAKPKTQILESMHRLNTGSSDWLKVIEAFREDRDILYQRLVECNDEVQTRIYQGELRWLTRFLSTLDSTSTTLHKRKESK